MICSLLINSPILTQQISPSCLLTTKIIHLKPPYHSAGLAWLAEKTSLQSAAIRPPFWQLYLSITLPQDYSALQPRPSQYPFGFPPRGPYRN